MTTCNQLSKNGSCLMPLHKSIEISQALFWLSSKKKKNQIVQNEYK